jgi:polyferredoxin
LDGGRDLPASRFALEARLAVIDASAAASRRAPASRGVSRLAAAGTAGLAALGDWMQRHPRPIQAIQWAIVVVYALLVVAPAFLPPPTDDARWYNNLVVAAQWLFWGIWWPFVIASMLVFGRAWCGVFCPEGTLTEAASRIGRGKAVPRWMKWGGWPFVAFALTTVYGQLVSVYQYATATLLVLGGSTVAAIGVGLVYGRGKRVWCRHLCPVNGVFAALARLSPLHFRVDANAWTANAGRIPVHPVNCAPLVRIRRMTSPAECHMCGRCSGLRGAINLAARPVNEEIARLGPESVRGWDAALIVFGMIGLAVGAFEWSATPAFVAMRAAAVTRVVDSGHLWLLADNAPWWLLTNYPVAHDVFTWLDGLLVFGWIAGTALVVGGWASLWLVVAGRLLPGRAFANAIALAYALTPLAAVGLFVGLTGLTTALARAEGMRLAWLPSARALLLALGAAWTLRLAHRMLRTRIAGGAHALALGAFAIAVAGILCAWVPFVFRAG